MSKRKNTLKDLDEFLKQQATSFVSPKKLPEAEPVDEVAATTTPEPETPPVSETDFEKVAADLAMLAKQEGQAFRKKFQELILTHFSQQSDLKPEDKVLINTLLYLKHGAQWQEAVRAYWKKHA